MTQAATTTDSTGTDALWRRSALELGKLIASKQVSSREVVEAHLRRIDEVNPRLHAVVQLRAEGALADARAADAALLRGHATGPLYGVPFTVKDWIETNDLPCAGGVEERRDYVAKRDATTVARLRAAGAILLGKTKPGIDDAVYPRANHPLDATRTPGGSSGGEAAIIAAGGSPLGLGSDSGGSLRWPAHCCGIVTIKPTNGRVPSTGHFPRLHPMSDPRTTIGPMARSVDDLALALRVIAGPDGRDTGVAPVPLGDHSAIDVRGLRVATYEDMRGAAPSEEVRAAVRAASDALADAGAQVEAATPPRLEEALPITISYWRRPSSASLSQWQPQGEFVLTSEEVERSFFEWDRFRRAMLAFMERYDVIICPVAEGPAPLHGVPVTGETYIYMLPYSLTGYPVAVVRAGTSREGLPLGVQVVAQPWRDDVALAAAAAIERALTFEGA